MPILFDTMNPVDDFAPESVSISTSGRYVIASNNQGTYLETVSTPRMEPIMILPFPCDTVGFFGKNTDVVALASGDTLRILQISKMSIVAKITIRPGSLFVPKYGESPYVGVLSESGQSFFIDENGDAQRAGLKVGEYHEVLWSSSMSAVGYSWTTGTLTNLYIRSRMEDKGAIVSSSHGINLYSVHRDYQTVDHIAHLSTHDEPHILKSAQSASDAMIVEPVVSFAPGTIIDRVSQLPDGRPIVVSGHKGAQVKTQSVGEESKLSLLIESILGNPTRLTSLQCVGLTNYLSWTQTPITPAVASVTNYSQTGRPRYEIATTRPDREVSIPISNDIHTVVGPGKKKTTYRVVSRYELGSHTADTAVVVIDPVGSVSAGSYSPSVEYLYRQGVAVVIVPVEKVSRKGRHSVNDELVATLDSVSGDLMNKKVARRLVLISSDELVAAAVKAYNTRRSRFERLLIIDPADASSERIPAKRSYDVQIVTTSDDLPRITNGIHQDVVLNNEDMQRVINRLIE